MNYTEICFFIFDSGKRLRSLHFPLNYNFRDDLFLTILYFHCVVATLHFKRKMVHFGCIEVA